jgi:hypothetical protein
MVCCFVEMDNGTMNRKQIWAKYRRYTAWAESPAGKQYLVDLYHHHGATEPRPTFRLLIIARSRIGNDDDHHRMLELLAVAAKLPATLKDRLWFTTVADLCHWQHDPLPLDAAIWRRGRGAPRPRNGVDKRSHDAVCRPEGLFPQIGILGDSPLRCIEKM